MTRLANPRPNRVEGWTGGIRENAPPALAESAAKVATVDKSRNFFATGTGKLAVRGGSQIKATLNAANKVLYLRPFTPVGAIAIAHTDTSSKHKLWRLTSDLAFYTGVEATSTHDLVWDKATPARPIGAELFEKMYIADATIDYAARKGLVCVDSAGTVTNVSFDLGGGAEQLKPYVCEEFNNHLFVAGYENKTTGADTPATLRHSYLGISPEAAGGFDPLAYNYIGAKGQRITGLKKGRGLMLVAKSNELHRVTGFGIAKPGWTFAVEQVQNTQGLGVSNPYAFTYAAGYWYGVGESGPWRSDGFSTESLVSARGRSWAQITNLAYSWVIYHPDRRCILFGLNQTPVPSGKSATYPTVIWAWDTQREVWITDISAPSGSGFTGDFHYAHAIPTTTALGPSAAPSGLAFTHASAALTSVAATWANGDATATTEIWVRDNETGASVLWQTALAAATSATIGGLVQGKNYKVKLRHIKNSIATDFIAEVDAYTLLPAPTQITLDMRLPGQSFVDVACGTTTTTHEYLERNASPLDDQSCTAPGIYGYHDTGLGHGVSYTWRARVYSSAWPAAIQYSAYTSQVGVTT